ncbi:MAG: cobalamin biosynthesis protein CbiM [Firmicutes bacterium HGW-Firmicutes-16]|nr:MAG: cobalamin biosynthesis protein CbiM [Firmicutes bacterium HGW-Firmicutes-16]
MHMADALLSPAVGGAMYAASAVTAIYSVKKVKEDFSPKKVPVMGVMGAFVFAAQMINFSIPGTGSSGHICGGILLAALLGPYAAFLSMIAILLIQCLLFADGGILALGCNIWNMAFYACFFGYFCLYKPIIKNGMSRAKIVLASVLGCVLSLQLGAFSVALETTISGISELPFSVFVAAMQPIHLAIGTIEGLITAAVLIFVFETRPELLNAEATENKFSLKKVLVIMGIVVVLVGGALSLVASSNPDGLEWSIGQVTGKDELDTDVSVHAALADVQEKTAVLPDYSFGNDNIAGTSFSGIVGSGLVAGLCILLAVIFGVYKKKKKADVEKT